MLLPILKRLKNDYVHSLASILCLKCFYLVQLKLPLVPCIVYVNIEGSGETARMSSASPLHSLFAFVKNTLFI